MRGSTAIKALLLQCYFQMVFLCSDIPISRLPPAITMENKLLPGFVFLLYNIA